MALVVAKSNEYKKIQIFFRVLGFFPFKFKNSFLVKLYQRVLYCLILPAAFFVILTNSSDRSEKSYINRLAKDCILCLGFVTLWVNTLEADFTRREQATIFSKLEEMNFTIAWITPRTNRLSWHIVALLIFNALNSILAMGSELLNLNILSRAINFWIHCRCIQIYFFKVSINAKLEMLKPLVRDQRIYDLKTDKAYSDVEKIKRALLKIREMNFYLNKCLGWSLLFILSHWLVIFTCHLYWLFLIIVAGSGETTVLGSISAITPKVVFLYLISNEISKANDHVSTTEACESSNFVMCYRWIQ